MADLTLQTLTPSSSKTRWRKWLLAWLGVGLISLCIWGGYTGYKGQKYAKQPAAFSVAGPAWVRLKIADSFGNFLTGRPIRAVYSKRLNFLPTLKFLPKAELGVTLGRVPYPAEILKPQQKLDNDTTTLVTNQQGEAIFELQNKGYYLFSTEGPFSQLALFYDPLLGAISQSMTLVMVPVVPVENTLNNISPPNKIPWSIFVGASNNVPVVRAILSISMDNFQTTLTTNQAGIAQVDLPTGEAKISVEHPAYVKLTKNVLIQPATLNRTSLQLELGYSLSGIVLDSFTRYPLTQAKILLTSTAGTHKILQPDRRGNFVAHQLPLGPLTVQVECPGYATYSQQIDIKNDLDHLEIVLEKNQ